MYKKALFSLSRRGPRRVFVLPVSYDRQVGEQQTQRKVFHQIQWNELAPSDQFSSHVKKKKVGFFSS
jgi:hypothetical protein